MGKSAKRKKEKKLDFQKPKLKVGKAKPKPSNQTDTNFRSKAIVLNQQSLNISAPDAASQFVHHASLLSSRSDVQRKESLSHMANHLAARSTDTPLPQPIGSILDKACPLILDGSAAVRNQVGKFFQVVGKNNIEDHASKILPFVRAGMTHLSREIRLTTLDFLSWLLDEIGQEVVSSPGGWTKTLESFITLLGWKMSQSIDKWSGAKASFGGEAKTTARVVQVLAQFLSTGFNTEKVDAESAPKLVVLEFPLWHCSSHNLPKKSNIYGYLNLFGTQTTEDQILEDQGDRIRVFNDRFRDSILLGAETIKQEGGELGRAAGVLTKTLRPIVSDRQ